MAVFPADVRDRLLYRGCRAEVWMQLGVTGRDLRANRGARHRQSAPPGRLALLLDAGNLASIGPLDAVPKLLAEGQVVLLTRHEVNAYLGPFIAEGLPP